MPKKIDHTHPRYGVDPVFGGTAFNVYNRQNMCIVETYDRRSDAVRAANKLNKG